MKTEEKKELNQVKINLNVIKLIIKSMAEIDSPLYSILNRSNRKKEFIEKLNAIIMAVHKMAVFKELHDGAPHENEVDVILQSTEFINNLSKPLSYKNRPLRVQESEVLKLVTNYKDWLTILTKDLPTPTTKIKLSLSKEETDKVVLDSLKLFKKEAEAETNLDTGVSSIKVVLHVSYLYLVLPLCLDNKHSSIPDLLKKGSTPLLSQELKVTPAFRDLVESNPRPWYITCKFDANYTHLGAIYSLIVSTFSSNFNEFTKIAVKKNKLLEASKTFLESLDPNLSVTPEELTNFLTGSIKK